jgi:hypothetical protein
MKYLYHRFIYRHLMRLSHKFNWHHMPPCYPEGDTMLHCSWCGIRIVTYRRNSPPLNGIDSAKDAKAKVRVK